MLICLTKMFFSGAVAAKEVRKEKQIHHAYANMSFVNQVAHVQKKEKKCCYSSSVKDIFGTGTKINLVQRLLLSLKSAPQRAEIGRFPRFRDSHISGLRS